MVFFKKVQPSDITVGELQHGEYSTIGTVPHSFFGNENPIFSISMVKYKNAIGAYHVIDKFKSIEERKCAIVKSGIEAYEVGKGKPKMSRADKDNRIYHSMKKIDDTYLPYLDGENVSRYLLTWNGEYIKYGPNLAAMRDPMLFRGPRILVRQIPTKSTYSIEATFVDKRIINDRNSMIITNVQDIPILALLGIINSKLMTLWFLMKFDKFQRRLFPQFKVNELAQFPLPPLKDKDKLKKLSQLVKTILDKKKKQMIIDEENSQVDELVMDLFGLNEAEKQSLLDFQF